MISGPVEPVSGRRAGSMAGEFVRLSWRSLSTYRLRSALTIVAISIGVTAVIVLVSLAQSGLATLARGIEDMGGSRYIVVWQDSPKKAALKRADYLDGLTLADSRALAREIPFIAHVSPMISSDDVYYIHRLGGKDTDCDRIGADSSFLSAYAYHLAAGRNLDAGDLALDRRVCLLGAELATKLFGDKEAVGQQVVLSGQRYQVVGRMAHSALGEGSANMNFGFDWNNLAVLPITVISPQGGIDAIGMTSRDPAENVDLINRANAILLARHNGVDDFQFLDLGGVLKGFKMVFAGMIAVVGLVAGVSLLIGGVGIMNIMLVAVQERRREIGIRRAIGATAHEIMGQFLVESTFLGIVGALVGTALGLGICWAAMLIGPLIDKGWVGVVSYPAIALAIVSAAGTGLFFGWYPARQASRLDPIACLRAR